MADHRAETSAPPLAFVVGEALIDIVVTPTSREKLAGGSPMNVACGLARLWMTTVLRAQLGDDENGRLIQRHLISEGVALDPASVMAHRTSNALARIQPDGRAEYVFDVTWDPGPITVPAEIRFVHTGSIAAAISPGSTEVLRAFRNVSNSVVRSFDPNIRPGVLGSRDEVHAATDALAALAHIVKMSDEDAAWLHPGVELDAIADHYLERGASVVAITRGADGCLIASRSGRVTRHSAPVDVVDTIGAGDAFMSGMLYAVHALELVDRVLASDLGETDLAALATIASESARIAVSRAGANPPTFLELMARVGHLIPGSG